MPDWAQRAGANWATRWNESISKVGGLTLTVN